VRKVERRLLAHYEALVADLAGSLSAESLDSAVAVASAPGLVRGYEDVKLGNVATYIARLSALGVDTAMLRQ